jgi:hypothetical protein
MEYSKVNSFLRRYPGLIVLILLSFNLALSTPQSWIIENEWIWEFSQSLGEVFPPIQAYIKKSEFSEITAFYFLVMWALSPLFYIWHMRHLRNEVKFGTPVSTLTLIMFAIPTILFFYGVVYFLLFINPGFDFNLLPINSSRLALGAFGWIFAGGCAFALLAFCVLFTGKLVSTLKQRF